MTNPLEYRDERGNIVASTEPRTDVHQTVEERMLDATRDGRLVDADETERIKDELLQTRREIASNTTMMASNSDAYLNGSWDDCLPGVMRQVADGVLKVLGHDCAGARRP